MPANPNSSRSKIETHIPASAPSRVRRPVAANPSADLYLACLSGDLPSVHWAVLQGADVSRVDRMGFRPLHLAASAGHSAVLDVLLARGARVNALSQRAGAYGGCTALHVAVAAGHEGAVQTLIDAGASLDRRDDAGFTALHTAALTGSRTMVKRLVAAGAHAEPFLADNTPLDLALRAGHHDVVGLLRQVTRRA